jgi:LCP family protein required for cell wall assembly
MAVLLAFVAISARDKDASIVIGKVAESPPPRSTPTETEPGNPEIQAPGLRPNPLFGAKGGGPGAALAFRGAVDVPKDLKFFLVVGSDARPGQDMLRSRADSIHVAAVDPLVREGTILGFPRDSYVNVPGHGKQKINAALALGGPDLLVRTVRELTGFPISYYAVTAFDGIVKMTDDLKGVDVKVPYRMDDHYSGARFEPGWHHMDGRQVLAFTRARHGVPGGDFGRSENQGRVIKHTLEKLRAETKNESGIRKWLGILYKRAKLNMSLSDAVKLGVLARQIVPSDLENKVTPGNPQMVGGQSVVVLTEASYQLFRDVGADAQADGDKQRGKPKGQPPGTSAGSTPKPKPKPTPKPTPIIELPEL